MIKKRSPKIFLKAVARILYHVVLVALSAGIAFSLPRTASFVAQKFLTFWATVENQKIILICAEIFLAVMLVLFFNYIGRNWRQNGAGLRYGPFFPYKELLRDEKNYETQEKTGFCSRSADRFLYRLPNLRRPDGRLA